MELLVFNFALGGDKVATVVAIVWKSTCFPKHVETEWKWHNAQLVGSFNRVEQWHDFLKGGKHQTKNNIWMFPKIVVPPKWLVYNGKPYWNGWFGGTIIFGNPHLNPPPRKESLQLPPICSFTSIMICKASGHWWHLPHALMAALLATIFCTRLPLNTKMASFQMAAFSWSKFQVRWMELQYI